MKVDAPGQRPGASATHCFFVSSVFSGEGVTDSEKEILVIPEAVSHPLDHLDFVVDALYDARSDVPLCVCQDAVDLLCEIPSELLKWVDFAVDGSSIPLFPKRVCCPTVSAFPKMFQVVSEDVCLVKSFVFRQVLLQTDSIFLA